MGVNRIAQGSPVIFFQEPRRLTIYMTSVYRRRRFIILIAICCLLLLIFGWYSKTSGNLSKLKETSGSTNEIFESYIVSTGIKSHPYIPTVREPQRENILIDFKNDRETSFWPSEKEVSGPEEYHDAPITRSYQQQPEYMELLPDPTYYGDNIPITFPSRKHPDLEFQFSGQTELEIPVTTPIIRHPDTKLKFTSPIEKDIVTGEIFVIPSMQRIKIDEFEKNNSYTKLSLDGTTPISLQVPPLANDTSLLIDTSGCKVPKLDPWDPAVKHLIELLEPYECPGPPLFMTPSADGSISLNKTILENYYGIKSDELRCYYQSIHRKHEDPGVFRENSLTISEVSVLNFGVPLNEDHVGVICILKDKTFEQYFPLVRLKKEVEEVKSAIPPPTPRLNVILAGIDSISRLNYLRHFRKTQAFIKEKLNMFEMNGYTKVGDNTFPNLVPLLTGHFVEHYWNDSLRDTMFFDDVDFIWKDYAKKGYRTFYAEDSPHTGTFNYLKRGFYDPPTDYYIRPLMLQLERSNLREKAEYEFCLNSQFEPEIIYDYLRNFMEAMGNRPYHAFAMLSAVTHDYLNFASFEDEPTVHILEDLLNMGALNNSLLVLFSDHGLRYGEIRSTYFGQHEERMPFMNVHVPKWFLDQYPQYAKNLEINQNRLMTLFDIHATMIHLLDLNRSPEERTELSMGRSLLEEISPNRTCEEANILPHWCPCQTFDKIPLHSSEAINASQAILDDINSILTDYVDVCEVLEVSEIMDARIGQTNNLLSQLSRHDNEGVNGTVVLGNRIKPARDYLITLATKTGLAEFEGTVRYDPENNSYTVLGISRISLYGNTSWCADKQQLKLFCYCKVQNPP